VAKSAVYSWRVSPDTKAALEDEARRMGESLSELLDRIAHEWLQSRRLRTPDSDDEQRRIRAMASKAIGRIAGRNPRRAERARATVRERLEQKRAR
jgi:hypothetical protein